ncbi:MAG TPA: SMP-30/gluconolactonase/LRE family protein [Dyella sp.]|uniref:SMP-30/gluconolactonase/LRE family protein n=1 Tax=Dyella sp. TaxID=1869338 RepID=UPI002F95957C
MPKIEPLTATRHALGEGVAWDERANVLRWTDILASRLWQYDPADGTVRHWDLPSRLGCFAATPEPEILLLALEKQLARLDLRDGTVTPLADIEPDLAGTRANDGRCDRHGNFVFGTINERGGEPVASFYRYGADGRLSTLDLPKAAITNSICFSPDGGTMYFCDTPTRRIMACDYDGATGEVDRIHLFAEVPAQFGTPDGSTVDADGFVWNAEWGASRIVRYAPDGRVDLTIDMPVSQPSCISFMGPGLDRLAITSAHVGLDTTETLANPLHGATFALAAPRGRGLPEGRYGATL